MELREALAHRLLGTAAVTALVGRRVHIGDIPQQEPLPLIVLAINGETPTNHQHGESAEHRSSIRVECWALRPTDARRLGETVRAALSGFAGTVTDGGDSHRVIACTRSGGGDEWLPPDGGRERGWHGVRHEFDIWHELSAVP